MPLKINLYSEARKHRFKVVTQRNAAGVYDTVTSFDRGNGDIASVRVGETRWSLLAYFNQWRAMRVIDKAVHEHLSTRNKGAAA